MAKNEINPIAKFFDERNNEVANKILVSQFAGIIIGGTISLISPFLALVLGLIGGYYFYGRLNKK